MEEMFRLVLSTSVYAGVSGLVILLLKSVLGRRVSPRWHYLLWIVLILKLMMPFGPESRFSLFNAAPLRTVRHAVVEGTLSPLTQGGETPEAVADPPSGLQTAQQEEDRSAGEYGGSGLPLSLLWMAGVCVMSVFLLIVHFRFRWNLRRKGYPPDARMDALLRLCAVRMGIRQKVGIVVQDVIKTPALFGLFKPVILLTPDILALPDRDISHVLLHELAHLKRKDVLVNYILLLFQAVHWFNPVLWYCFHCIRQDMEMATDERALSVLNGNAHREYGESLILVLEHRKAAMLFPRMIGMIDNTRNMKRRILMMKRSSLFRGRRGLMVVLGVLCITLLGVFLLTNGTGMEPGNVAYAQSGDTGEASPSGAGADEALPSEVEATKDAPEDNDGNPTEDPTLESPAANPDSKQEMISETGLYVGQIDSNSIEVKVDGVTDGPAEKAYRLEEAFREDFAAGSYEEGEAVILFFKMNENDQPVVFKMERK